MQAARLPHYRLAIYMYMQLILIPSDREMSLMELALNYRSIFQSVIVTVHASLLCITGAVGLTGRTFPVAEKTLVWLDGVDCSGKESRLAECPANPIGITYSCGRYIAAGVRCAGILLSYKQCYA